MPTCLAKLAAVMAGALMVGPAQVALAAHDQNIRRCQWHYDHVCKVNVQRTPDTCDKSLIKAQNVGTWKFHNNRGEVFLVPCTP
jgi:hypothetical protein